MSLTVNAKTYNADSHGVNAEGYAGPAHTMTVKDYIRLLRVAPKPTATFSGVGKTSCKLTRTNTLTGALTPTWDGIYEFSSSVPVGTAGADVDSALNDLGALIASASFKLMVKNQQINF